MFNDEVTRHVAYFDEEGYQLAPRPWVQDGEALIAFLRARLDEREATLHQAGPARVAWATFRHTDGSMRYTSVVSENGDVWVCDGHDVEPASVRVVLDPVQELADVAAKRRILNECLKEVEREAGSGRRYPASTAWALAVTTLRLLAFPYEEHPDYDERWRP